MDLEWQLVSDAQPLEHGASDRARDRQAHAGAAEPLRCARPFEGGREPLITSYHPSGASTARHPLRGMVMRRLVEEQKKTQKLTLRQTTRISSLEP